MRYSIGIDIGGTKIASGIINENGDVIQQAKVLSDPSDQESMFQQVVLCVRRLLNHTSIPLKEIAGIGAGVPGKVDVANGIAVFQNNIPWPNFPLKERLQEVFPVERITIDNDVYMATYAEWKQTNMDFEELFTYMTISTGISCAMIQKGEFLRGAGFAGELGLVPVMQETQEGNAIKGTLMQNRLKLEESPGDIAAKEHSEKRFTAERLEKVAAGPAVEKSAVVLYGDEAITAEDLFMKFYKGERQAKLIVHQMADALAQGVYTLVSVIDPHKIVVGGSVATENPVLVDLVKEKLKSFLLEEQSHIVNEITVSTMEESQGLVGAGLRVLDGK